MKKLSSSEIRQMYLDFFQEKGHKVHPSASLIPVNDPTLLWINSGVATLKKYFDGTETPEVPRITNAQKSIRTNDIENVGHTARHHTLFEMMGNFSIGDYFKEEVIPWAWEFLTSEKWLGLDPDRLYVTYYPKDPETKALWMDKVGLPEDHIIPVEDNFWDIGAGPCGPDTEIFYDRGEKYNNLAEDDPENYPGGENERYLEIWNLVFSQFNHMPDGTYPPLPHKNVDTGMGLERVVSVIQDTPTNFETDLFMPIIKQLESLSDGKKYNESKETDVSFKVIADHIRTVAFAIADGALPSNEGRGYILRRLLRRAVRFAKVLGLNNSFMYKLTDVVAEIMEDYYPNVKESANFVKDVILKEEDRFHETLHEGETILNNIAKEVKDTTKVISGKDAFKLYDTFGFPIELTEEYAEELGLTVDIDGFNEEMEKQKERARSSRQDDSSMQVQSDLYSRIVGDSEFTGYTNLTDEGKVLAIVDKEDNLLDNYKGEEVVKVVFERTPFYAESGGQVADKGLVTAEGFKAEVVDVKKLPDKRHIHFVKVVVGELVVGKEYKLEVDRTYRLNIEKNHTATHLLNEALRHEVGSHIKQAGSLVTDEKLRFDITHFAPLTKEEIEKVEQEVNKQIWNALEIKTEEMPIAEARKLGAQALFGEKYGDVVRVVSIGDYSIELCGGTHNANSAEVGIFKIVSESGVAAGVRRIEALTGKAAYEYLRDQEETLRSVEKLTKANASNVVEKVSALQSDIKKLSKEKESLQQKIANAELNNLVNNIKEVNGVNVLTSVVESENMNHLKQLVDNAKSKLENYVIAFASVNEDKVNFVVAVDKAITDKYNAGKLVNVLATVCDGRGGGRPDMAQAGAKNKDNINKAFDELLANI